MSVYVEMLTYQGRPPGSSQPTGVSVVFGEEITQFGRTTVVTSDPMPLSEAEALGFGLPAVAAAINAEALAENQALKEQIAALQAELAASQSALAERTIVAEDDVSAAL